MARVTPPAAVLRKAHAAHTTRERANRAAELARKRYRAALAEAHGAGWSYQELGRQMATSTARVREDIMRHHAEASQTRPPRGK